MGGSTGVISEVGGSPTTSYGEQSRQVDSYIQGSPTSSEQTRQIMGVVGEIHPTNPRFVTAYTPDGAIIAEGGWVELNHSADEIAERFGTIRAGFKLRVTIWGAGTGNAANASIIGTEDSAISEPYTDNEIDQSLYAIFAAGSG